MTASNNEFITAFGFYDNHPANCIASWICPGTTANGYPEFTLVKGPETGCKNLAVYWGGCNYSCGFCQDWIHEVMKETDLPRFTEKEMMNWVDDSTTCVCFCGGTPDISMKRVTALAASYLNTFPDRILRICAETNLTAPLQQLLEFSSVVVRSGGGLNIGLKAGSEKINKILTGRTNADVWYNFQALFDRFGPGEPVPFLRPSLLLVPGYIDRKEVQLVCRKIAGIDKNIPLKFISFIPRHKFANHPETSPSFMKEAVQLAISYGIKKVSPTLDEIEKEIRLIR